MLTYKEIISLLLTGDIFLIGFNRNYFIYIDGMEDATGKYATRPIFSQKCLIESQVEFYNESLFTLSIQINKNFSKRL